MVIVHSKLLTLAWPNQSAHVLASKGYVCRYIHIHLSIYTHTPNFCCVLGGNLTQRAGRGPYVLDFLNGI